MNRKMFVILAVLAVAAFGVPASAGFVSIDADGFGDGSDISNSFAGVSLSSVGQYPNLDGKVYAAEDTLASTGDMVFANNLAFGREWSTDSDLGFALRVDFDQLADYVAIDFIGDDAADSAIIKAYDSQDRLVAASMAYLINEAQVVRAQLNRPDFDIAYIVAGGLTIDGSPSTVHLDNIQANVVPEPATMALLGLGGLLIRRKK